jgi:hypothetical protein
MDDKIEFIAFDPVVQQEALYKEVKKVRSIQEPLDTWYNRPSILKTPDEVSILSISVSADKFFYENLILNNLSKYPDNI